MGVFKLFAGLFKTFEMEDTESIDGPKPSWSFQRKAVFLNSNDVFFDEGNEACSSDNKHYVTDQEVDQLSELFSTIDADLDNEEYFECEVKGCKETFRTSSAYEIHVSCSHRFTCQECKRNFPTNFLLDIHIAENHDSFFQAKVERGQAPYVCLVEACNEKFENEKDRHKHLIEVHKYPSNFRFNRKKKQRKSKADSKDNSMEIDDFKAGSDAVGKNPATRSNFSKMKEVKGIPKTINFGRGGSKSFQRGRGRAKPKMNDKSCQ